MMLLVFLLATGSLYKATALSLWTPKDGTQKCQAENNSNLQPIINDFLHFIPQDKILSIVLKLTTQDKEVQDVLAYLKSDESLKRIESILKSEEFSEVIQFSCDRLHLDLVYYINTITSFLGLPLLDDPNNRVVRSVLNPISLSDSTRNIPSPIDMRSVILNILDTFQLDEVKTSVNDKVRNDERVRLLIEAMQSPKGQEIINKLGISAEVKKLLEDVVKLGVDLYAVIEDLKNVFGWK